MTGILTELLNSSDLIEKLGSDDELFFKIERAATTVAQHLRDQPFQLIRAVLAGLDPDIPADDPAIARAEQALLGEWKLMRSVFPDNAVNLHRAVLLEACNQAADDGVRATVLWLTAADTLSLLRLGRQEAAIRGILTVWAEQAERHSLREIGTSAPESAPLVMPQLVKLDMEQIPKVNIGTHDMAMINQPQLQNTNHIHGILSLQSNIKTWADSFTMAITPFPP